MRGTKRGWIGGVILLGLGWLLYLRTGYRWYEEQMGLTQKAIATGSAQLSVLERQMETLETLTGEVAYLELLQEGVDRQLPPLQEEWVLWERLQEGIRDYKVEQLMVLPRGAQGGIGAGEGLRCTRFEVSYKSDYKESIKVIRHMMAMRQIHTIEQVALTADEQQVGRWLTTLQVGVYSDPAKGVSVPNQGLGELLGSRDIGPGEMQSGDVQAPSWEMKVLPTIEGVTSYEVCGQDGNGQNYKMTVSSKETPQIQEQQVGDERFLVIETSEGEKVTQWLGK